MTVCVHLVEQPLIVLEGMRRCGRMGQGGDTMSSQACRSGGSWFEVVGLCVHEAATA